MAIYLAKMSMHDINLAVRLPSLLAVGAIYVALKICEQLKKKEFINANVVTRLINVSKMGEDQILDVSQKVLYLAQNFDREFPNLENLKKTHFGIITQLLWDYLHWNESTFYSFVSRLYSLIIVGIVQYYTNVWLIERRKYKYISLLIKFLKNLFDNIK